MKKNKLPRALVTTLLLSLALVTTLTGCGDDDPAPPSARARSVTVMPNTENPGSAYQQREGTLNYFITIEGDSGIFPVDLLGNNVQIGRLVAGQFQEVAGLSISSTTRFVAASGWETALTLLIDGDLIPAGTHSFAILVHGVDAVFQAGILDPAPVRFAIEELRNLWDVGNLPSTLTISTDIGNELLRPQLLAFGGASVAITIRGTSSNNTLTLADTGPIFTVGTGVTLILEDIELVGINNNNNSLVVLNGGTLEMRSGSVIRGNTSDNVATGGGVTINANGTFNMSGGTISGNTASSNENNAGGGGVRINHGTFNMSADAVITGNRQLGGVNVSNSLGGGGVRVSGPTATFNMLGGTISNNSATRSGGGVRVVAGRFHISGGTVYGTNDAAALRNTAARESSLSTEPGLGQPPANFARGTALVGTTFNTINVGNSGLGIGTNFTVEVAGGALLRPIAPESFTVTGIDSEHDGRLFRVLLRGGGDWISLGGVETEITIPDTTIEVWPVWTVGLGDWDLALEIWDLDQGNVSDHVLDLELKENEYLTLELGKDNFIAFSDFTVPTRVTGVTITGIEQTYITDGAWRLYSSDNGWDSWINIPGPGLVIANFPDNSVAVNLSGVPGEWAFRLDFFAPQGTGFIRRTTYINTATLTAGRNTIPFALFTEPDPLTSVEVTDINVSSLVWGGTAANALQVIISNQDREVVFPGPTSVASVGATIGPIRFAGDPPPPFGPGGNWVIEIDFFHHTAGVSTRYLATYIYRGHLEGAGSIEFDDFEQLFVASAAGLGRSLSMRSLSRESTQIDTLTALELEDSPLYRGIHGQQPAIFMPQPEAETLTMEQKQQLLQRR